MLALDEDSLAKGPIYYLIFDQMSQIDNYT